MSPSLHLKTEIDLVSQTLCFLVNLEYRTMDKVNISERFTVFETHFLIVKRPQRHVRHRHGCSYPCVTYILISGCLGRQYITYTYGEFLTQTAIIYRKSVGLILDFCVLFLQLCSTVS
jgi:hypothetical protein